MQKIYSLNTPETNNSITTFSFTFAEFVITSLDEETVGFVYYGVAHEYFHVPAAERRNRLL